MAKKQAETKAVAKQDAKPGELDDTSRFIRENVSKGLLGGSVAALPLEGVVGKRHAQEVGMTLVAEIIRDIQPTSAIERMMCEQMALIHAQVLDLSRIAKRMEYLDQKEKAFGLVVKMQGEFRKTAAALKEWRAPTRQFIVAQQANVAHQQVINQLSPEPMRPITNEVGSNDG